jgi:hypothetical protein
MILRRWLITIGLVAGCGCAAVPGADPALDPAFRPVIADPEFPKGRGPVVWLDHGHNNIVNATPGSRYGPFVAALRADGYTVRPLRVPITEAVLIPVQLLVIGNALHARNVKDWSLPTPSAFTTEEIRILHEWVNAGGELLLLVDHMPSAGAGTDLGHAFGVEFLNGVVEDPQRWDPAVFRRDNGTLLDHPITRGTRKQAGLQTVATFDGSAFRAPDAEALLVLGPEYVSYQMSVAWKIDSTTPQLPVGGWLQGAVRVVGQGRLAVFSDASMFSATIKPDGSRMGMNTIEGTENLQLLRNVMRWLRGQ